MQLKDTIPYLKVSQVKVGDVLTDEDHLSWKEWEGSNKPLTVIKKGGVLLPFILKDKQGKEYKANGQRLTSYGHTIIHRDGQVIGRFFCRYW